MVNHGSERFECRLAGEPGELHSLRVQLSGYLTAVGAGRGAVDRLVLATHEVAVNACLHPVPRRPVLVAATAACGRVMVKVRDHGPWRDRRRPRSEGGLGLEVARQLVDRLAIHQAPGGTTVVLEAGLGAE
jgi:anti-sigma regulatory factor (Ser/Thr protein kinase)